MNKLEVISTTLIPEVQTLGEHLEQETEKNHAELEKLGKIQMDREQNTYVKSIRSSNNKKMDASKSQIKELETRILDVLLGDLRVPLSEYNDSLSALSKTADEISKKYVKELESERADFINNYIVTLIEGYEYSFDDVEEVVDTILGHLPSNITKPLSTTENKVITEVSAWFESTIETCQMFDLSFEDFYGFKFSEKRYNAHIKDLLSAKTKAEQAPQINTPNRAENAGTSVGTTTGRVLLNEKLNKKKSARLTFDTVISKQFKEAIATCREASLTDEEIILVVKGLI